MNKHHTVRARAAGPLRTSHIAASVGLALAQWSVSVHADSGVGQDTFIGNALNRVPLDTSTYQQPNEEEGLGPAHTDADSHSSVARTPTGQMYRLSPSIRESSGSSAAGMTFMGHVEFGAVGASGDRDRQGYRRYKDLSRSGPYLNNFALTGQEKDGARYFELTGGAVGRDDQFYLFNAGRYNDWKVRAFYNETQHIFTTNYRSLFSGVGTGNLTLTPTARASGLSAGGVRADGSPQPVAEYIQAANNAFAATKAQALGLTRSKGGIRGDFMAIDNWRFFGSFTSENRKGARPLGYTYGGGGTSATIDIAEPINYDTHDAVIGAQYADKVQAFNFTLSGSWFRNNIDTLTIENPMGVWAAAPPAGSGLTSYQQARFDLYPGNDYYNMRGEYARTLPFWNSRFTATGALAQSIQDDSLIPFSVNPVSAGGLDNWNTTGSLSKQTADARISTKLLNLGVTANPVNDLSVRGKFRYYETHNSTEFLLCNSGAGSSTPLNPNDPSYATAYGCAGIWGRLHGDGSLNALGSIAAGNNYIRNIPWDYKQTNYGLESDYRLSGKASLNGSYEREEFNRRNRERDKTWEDKLKFGYVNRAIGTGTLRMSAEHDRRRGSTYNTDPYEPFYSGYIWPVGDALAASADPNNLNLASWLVHMNSLLRKYDLADRDQNILNLRYNFAPRQDIDVAFSGQYKDIKYPTSDYGRDHQRLNSLNVDVTWQPSSRTSLSAFYGWQQGRFNQNGVASGAQPNGVTACNIATAGSLSAAEDLCADPTSNMVYNATNKWSQNSKDNNNTVGLGLRQEFAGMILDVSYNFALGRTKIGYNGVFANTGAGAQQAALAGNGWDTLKTQQQTLEFNLIKRISKSASLRFVYRYEQGKIDDWHYSGLSNSAAVPVGTSAVTVQDGGPQKYHANFFGVLLNIRM
jgi:hypothetical protein